VAAGKKKKKGKPVLWKLTQLLVNLFYKGFRGGTRAALASVKANGGLFYH
jgi:hypothetical protein